MGEHSPCNVNDGGKPWNILPRSSVRNDFMSETNPVKHAKEGEGMCCRKFSPSEVKTENMAMGLETCRIPHGHGQAFSIKNSMSVRTEIENKLLQEICQSTRTPGLYERQRNLNKQHPNPNRYHAKKHVSPLKHARDTSPFTGRINGKIYRDTPFYGGQLPTRESPFSNRVSRPTAKKRLSYSLKLEDREMHARNDRMKTRKGDKQNCAVVVHEDPILDNVVANDKSVAPVRAGGMDHEDPVCDDENILEKIKSYNRGISMEAFLIKPPSLEKERKVEFQGVLRFYLDEEEQQASKAIRLKNSTTVLELLPLVREKFGFERHLEENGLNNEGTGIFLRRPDGDLPLEHEAKPLELALASHTRPRFIVRFSRTENLQDHEQYNEIADDNFSGEHYRETKHRSSRHGRDVRRSTSKRRRERKSDSETGSVSETSVLSMESQTDNRASADEGFPVQSSRRRKKEKKDKKERRERSLDRISEQLSFRKGSMRLSRSMSNLVQKTFSLRQKENPFRRQSELSTEDSAPGVLKIFGDTIIPGAEYKSVLATPTSSAKELAKEALERYGISRRQVRHYVLCDVIGKFVPKEEATQEVVKKAKHYRRTDQGVWIEECLRVVSDNERPLTIQQFWKPTIEFSRRFELRKRSDIVRHIDNFTSGINANARRLLLSKAKLEGVTHSPPQNNEIYSQTSANDSFVATNDGEYDDKLSRTLSLSDKSKSRVDNKGLLKAPAKHPYFLSLRSYDSAIDNLVYVIRERVTMVGRANDNIGRDDISLNAPDILNEHCWISRSIDDNTPCSMTIDPLPNAKVAINGNRVISTAKLHPGDVITMGEHYVFLYKSPLSETPPSSNAPQEKHHNFDLSNLRQTLDSTSTTISSSTSCYHDGAENSHVSPGLLEDPEMLKWRRDRRSKYESDSNRIKLNFVVEKRDALLDCIMKVMDTHPHAPKLSLAYLVSMCVDYSLSKHDVATTRNLLSTFSASIQNVVWEATKDLADKQANLSSHEQGNVHCLIRDIQVVNLWLANAVELHFFFRKNVRDVLRMCGTSLPPMTQETESLPEDEMVVVLEDVVMYCFQQIVYYLTKALYAVLSAVLESNPFINDALTTNHPGQTEKTVDALIAILHTTLTTMTDFSVHPHIISQLFCYLFFFTSTSLFNMLMGKDAGKKYYRWSRGAQLRGNLDAIETWAGASGLGREAQMYMKKINTLANLLATPKVQLLTATWHDLQRDFPSLKNEQLLKVLSEYDVGHGKDHPEAWMPPDGAIDPSAWSSRILESFSNYPPLKLPKSAFTMNLSAENHDEILIDVAHQLSSEFGVSDDDRDSGLSVSQTLPVFTDIPRSPVFMEDHKSQRGEPFSISTPIACHAGSSDLNNSPCPIPPKRKSRDDRKKALSLSIPNTVPTAAATSCDSATIESPGDKSLKEADLGDSGIGLSCEQKVFRYGESLIYSPDEERAYNKKSEQIDNCNASQAMGVVMKTGSMASRSHTWSHDQRQDRFQISHQRHASEKHLKPPPGASSCTCTGPLAMSSPISSDSNTPCPSPIDATTNIPPQPRDPAPTLDRSSLKKKRKDVQTINSVALASPADECKVVEIKHLMPPTPDGVVNGLRVLPLSELDDDVPPNHRNPRESKTNGNHGGTDLLKTIEIDKGGRNQGEDDGLPGEEEEEPEDVVIVDLVKGERGLGLGLIDGLFTPLRRPGIYVRTLVHGEPAEKDGRLHIGDRILAVNGKSLVGSDYQSAMKTIRDSGTYLRFLVAKGNRAISMQITASSC